MKTKHPSDFFPELYEERLAIVAELLLDIRFNTIREMDSPHDDSYTRECAVFGRTRNAIVELCQSPEHEWLDLASPGMDVTFKIGQVPCRFFRDDPESPEKRGFFRRNRVDDLFSVDDSEPVMWRFVIEKAMTDEDEDRAFFIGHNVYQEKVCQWSYGPSGTVLHSVDNETPPIADIPSPEVGVREEEEQQEHSHDHDTSKLSDAQNE
ncbi:hypothetical protein [Salinicola peritrichatus]|uniref:hypothetical protein n=1 Tax=Salinicola peritrichatus TaxID=1267424 RepID=UPI0013A67E6C|nr:hypothetical protein [Salinicola peritrichatus]